MDIFDAIGKAANAILRYQTPEDDGFLKGLFAENRRHEFAPLGELMRSQILEHQYRIQAHQYEANYPDAFRLLVEANGKTIGRLLLSPNHHTLHIVDIALLPPWQRQGYGTRLLKGLLDYVATSAAFNEISLNVEETNPALALYKRLGFCTASSRQPYIRMIWPPLSIEMQQLVTSSAFLARNPQLVRHLDVQAKTAWFLERSPRKSKLAKINPKINIFLIGQVVPPYRKFQLSMAELDL